MENLRDENKRSHPTDGLGVAKNIREMEDK